MHVALSWLKELVPVTLSPAELADRLELTGTAIEAIRRAGEGLDGVVVGLIAEKEQHPDAERLWVTRVDIGEAELRTIVCGAQNFNAGDKVPVAIPGAVLPNGMEIKIAKLRGVRSEGMNCSAKELGLGDDHDGLLILPADAPVGMPFSDYTGASDVVLELEVTPNRPDCLSMVGVAREVAAVTGAEAVEPRFELHESGAPLGNAVRVEIEDGDLCARYCARLIRGVRIGPSPDWLAEKVRSAGARPISNVVDVTNYVMFELGQPLHAFDADLLHRDASGVATIGVRVAHAGETLRTLDGQDRSLSTDTLLITDGSGPIALAGVMGGESTEVHDGTVDVLLESARFDPATTSRTSRKLGLVSEASSRFEKGVDREGCMRALDRAAALIVEVAGGEVAAGAVDEYPAPHVPRTITLRHARVEAIIGAVITPEDVVSILTSLGCDVHEGGTTYEVLVPGFRPDLEREIDLVEEVLRVWGMDRVPATLPGGRGRVGALNAEQTLRERIGATLRALGLNETMTYSFADPADLERLNWPLAADEVLVELLNPMSGEHAVMRRTLLPGLLRSVSYNQRRGIPDVHLYEMGRVFVTATGRKQPKERDVIAGVLAGRWSRPSWYEASQAAGTGGLDFFDGKGVLESLMEEYGIDSWKVRSADVGHLQPGRSAQVLVRGDVVGWLGEIAPDVLDAFEAQGPVVAFELALAPLMRAATSRRPYREIPRYPAVSLDMAFVVSRDVTAERIVDTARKSGGTLLEEVRVFDAYSGPGVPDGHVSVALAFTYRASDKTLTAEDVEPIHRKVVDKVCRATGATVRA